MKAKVVLAAVALFGGLLPAALSASAQPDDVRARRGPDDLRLALENGRLSRAEYTLERASSLFDLASARRRFGEVRRADPHAATLLLRDLSLRLDELSADDKKRANRLLARPTDGAADPQGHGYSAGATTDHACMTKTQTSTGKQMRVCIHWVTTAGDADAPDLTDVDPPDGTPDYVANHVMPVLSQVWETEINELGFRMPLWDRGSTEGEGPNKGVDIYLADIGEDGIYGYCENDAPIDGRRRQSAYCVLDNDYAEADFAPGVHGIDALKIAAAHEFFHAVQFAYDWLERRFFMEGTAVWIEDEVFDEVNALYEYLHDSPLHQPEISLDAGDFRPDENFEYGSWLFWRFASERYNRGTFIKDLWERASRRVGVFGALRGELAERNSTIPDAYARFALWNYTIDNDGLQHYEEGDDFIAAVDYHYPPRDGIFWLGGSKTSTGDRRVHLAHLSMRYIEFLPEREGKLKLEVDIPRPSTGRVKFIVFTDIWDGSAWRDDYCLRSGSIRVDERGVGVKRVPFWVAQCGGQTRDVRAVMLVLVNGSLGSARRFMDEDRFEYSGKIVP